jgi:prevent-host-death family protein
MRATTVSQLKMSLSACLRQVKAGEELVITKRGQPIARLLPFASSEPLPEHLRDLEEKGFLKRGEKPLPVDFWDLPRPADPQAAVRSVVLREREESW